MSRKEHISRIEDSLGKNPEFGSVESEAHIAVLCGIGNAVDTFGEDSSEEFWECAWNSIACTDAFKSPLVQDLLEGLGYTW